MTQTSQNPQTLTEGQLSTVKMEIHVGSSRKTGAISSMKLQLSLSSPGRMWPPGGRGRPGWIPGRTPLPPRKPGRTPGRLPMVASQMFCIVLLGRAEMVTNVAGEGHVASNTTIKISTQWPPRGGTRSTKYQVSSTRSIKYQV